MSTVAWVDLAASDPALEDDVTRKLEEIERELGNAATSDFPLLGEAAGYLLAAGGKRFRPLLVVLGGHFGDSSDPRLVTVAVAVELTHLATLYHDDVIDESLTRRGIPSANARWDNTVAILTGDYLFARASEISSALGADITGLLARTIADVSEGQIREVTLAGRLEADESAYLEVIKRKTASLISASCRLGGLLSGADPRVVDGLERYGEALGLAFQLSDDIMDITAEAAALGKEPGSDIREGVYTLPVIHALRESSRRDALRELLDSGPPSGEALAEALEIIRSDGALGAARDAVTREVGRAREEAGALPEGRAREALIRLAEFLAARCGAKI
jgi:geranylgeranyl pyrophosphate synthase